MVKLRPTVARCHRVSKTAHIQIIRSSYGACLCSSSNGRIQMFTGKMTVPPMTNSTAAWIALTETADLPITRTPVLRAAQGVADVPLGAVAV